MPESGSGPETRQGIKPWVAVAAFVAGIALAALFFSIGSGGAAAPAAGGSQDGSASTAEASATESSDAAASDGGSSVAEGAVSTTSKNMAQVVAEFFPSWVPDSPALAQLISYVDEVTNEKSADYVEPAERVATFDMDGTIICEKAPIYVDYCMLIHRLLDDSTYAASPELTELARTLRANADKGVVDDDLDDDKAKAFGEAFSGMTQEEFITYVKQYLATEKVGGFEGMTYGESFYKPMLEVIEYLRANDFDVWMVSACERDVVRAATEDLGFAPDHVIATDMEMVATGQGDKSGSDYTYALDDKLVYGSELLSLTAKLNKVIAIQTEIGRRPVLAFGNSSGDFAMLNYAQSNPEHKGMGLFVVCDDTEREYGNDEKAADYRKTVTDNGWVGISMRDDWATIYGPGVEKTKLPADAADTAKAQDGKASATSASSATSETEEAELAQAA